MEAAPAPQRSEQNKEEPARGRHLLSLRNKLVALTVGLFVLFIWVLTQFAFSILQNQFYEVLSEQQFAATKHVAAELNNKLEERIQGLVRAASQLPDELDPHTATAFLAQQTGLHLLFSAGIGVIGLDGRAIGDYPIVPGRQGTDFSDRDYFRQVLVTARPYIDKPIMGRVPKRPLLVVAVPAFDRAGKPRAVLVGATDLGAANFLGIVADRGNAGQGEFFVITRREKIIVAATDSDRVLTLAPGQGANQLLDRFVEGFEGSGLGRSSRGIAKLYSAKGVPAADWFVMAALPAEVAGRPVEVMRWYLYLAASVMTLLAIVAVLWMTRQVLAPLVDAGRAMRRMTSGEIPLAPLAKRGEDEIGQFIDSFNLLLGDRQRYETALADSEQRFRMLVESAPDAIFVQTRGCFAYLNQAALQLFGACSKAELLGTAILDRLHPDSRGVVEARMRAINAERRSNPPLAEKYLRLDGTTVDVEVSAVPFRYENEDGALVFVRDITARKKAEEALLALNKDFVALLDNTSDFIYFKDEQSRFRFCSQTLARITGHTSWRDMIGKHDREVFPEDTAQVYAEEEEPIFRDGTPLLDRIDPYYDEEGRPGWVSTNKWPVFGDDGKSVVGIFGISRVVTERVRAEAELLAANRELQGFTYAASHDMKAPLGRIASFSALLERDYGDRLEGNGRLFLDLIRQNATRLTALIEDLLAHAQIEQQILSLQPVDLQAAVQGILREAEAELQLQGIRLQLDLPDIKVRANAYGLGQVLRNLLENARKYSAEAKPPVIEIGALVSEGVCRLWVRDNGIGFDMAYHDRIFEIFRRLHTYDEFPGSGVGLALVKKAMERMDGRVWAESAPGQGATFYLELAAAE